MNFTPIFGFLPLFYFYSPRVDAQFPGGTEGERAYHAAAALLAEQASSPHPSLADAECVFELAATLLSRRLGARRPRGIEWHLYKESVDYDATEKDATMWALFVALRYYNLLVAAGAACGDDSAALLNLRAAEAANFARYSTLLAWADECPPGGPGSLVRELARQLRRGLALALYDAKLGGDADQLLAELGLASTNDLEVRRVEVRRDLAQGAVAYAARYEKEVGRRLEIPNQQAIVVCARLLASVVALESAYVRAGAALAHDPVGLGPAPSCIAHAHRLMQAAKVDAELARAGDFPVARWTRLGLPSPLTRYTALESGTLGNLLVQLRDYAAEKAAAINLTSTFRIDLGQLPADAVEKPVPGLALQALVDAEYKQSLSRRLPLDKPSESAAAAEPAGDIPDFSFSDW